MFIYSITGLFSIVLLACINRRSLVEKYFAGSDDGHTNGTTELELFMIRIFGFGSMMFVIDSVF